MISLSFKLLTSGKYSAYIVCDYPKFYKRKYKKLNILLSKDYSRIRKIAPQDKQLLEKAKQILFQEKERLSLIIDTDPSLTSFIRKWSELGGKSHRKQLIMHLENFCGKKAPRFDKIDHAWMDSFKEYLSQKLSMSSVATLLRRISTCYNKAVANGSITENPVRDYNFPESSLRERIYLEDDEIQCLIQSEASIKAIIRDTFLFSLYSGIRFDDIRELTPLQVTMTKTGTITSFEMTLSQLHEKYFKVKLDIKASAILAQYYNPSSPKVFTGMPHLPLFNSRLHLWAAWAGVDKSVSFSVARHTYIIMLLKKGMSLPSVRKLVGFNESSDVYIYERMVKGLQ